MNIPPWSGQRRARAHAQTKRVGRNRNLPCCLCGSPIDYNLTYPDPNSMSVQHLRSRHIWPELTWDPNNWAPAHLRCNQQAGDGTNANNLGVTTPLWAPQPTTQPRKVILLCGPPTPTLTKAAQQTGQPIWTPNDPQWTSPTDWNNALTNLGHTPGAQATILRPCPTSHQREQTRNQTGATHTYLAAPPTLTDALQTTTNPTTQQTIRHWYQHHDNNDQTPTWQPQTPQKK